MSSVMLQGIVGFVSWGCAGRAELLCWWRGVGGVSLGMDSACIIPHAVYCTLMFIGAPRMMLVLMKIRFYRLGGVPNMSQCNRD